MLDWLACTLVKLVSGLLCRVPPGFAVWVGERFGLAAYWLQPKRTRIGLLNVRAAFDPSTLAPRQRREGTSIGVVPSERPSTQPSASLRTVPSAVEGRSESRDDGQVTPARARRIIRDCYKQLGAGFVELLRLPVIDRAYIDRYIAIEGRAHFDTALAAGKPVILLTGHYGNWELSSITAALHGYPITALARAQDKLPKLYRLLVSYRESKGCRIIHKGGAMKRVIAALEQRQLVGIVGDQASRQGIFVDFFGRQALFATGPFELARGKGAVILPAFIRRVRGPFHRLAIEPPIVLSRQGEKADAIREGIEQFAEALTRHIREEPSQWLWMHKRWKHTPARRAIILSDGKAGHVKQSLAVAEALRASRPELSCGVVEIRYRSESARVAALLWSWLMPWGIGTERCLRWTLTSESASALLGRYADLIISCGAAAAPVNLLWASELRAKSIVVMTPSPLPLRRFHLVVAPTHDGLPRRPNVVETVGALVDGNGEERLRQAHARLSTHPNFRQMPHDHPVIAVFIGGESAHHELSPAFAAALMAQVQIACEAIDGWCLVTTSRRTSPAVERLLAERLGRDPRCRLLLIASRDPLDGTMEGMLGSADVAVVTGESVSMVSEACASGRRVVVVEPPLRRPDRVTSTKHRRFLSGLVSEGYARLVPLPEVGEAIQRAVTERREGKRLDNVAMIRDALRALLP